MDKMTKKIVGIFVIILAVAALIVAGYYFMNKQGNKDTTTTNTAKPGSEVGKLLAKDLDSAYPGTPTELVKMYWRFNSCMYNTKKIADSDFEGLLTQLRLLYDSELLADEDNSFDTMKENFLSDREKYQDKGTTIATYIVQKGSKVEIVKNEGKEYATVISSVLTKTKGKAEKSYEEFICRKSDDGKWKIMGWRQTTQKSAKKVGLK